jgi:hypothetical protein
MNLPLASTWLKEGENTNVALIEKEEQPGGKADLSVANDECHS